MGERTGIVTILGKPVTLIGTDLDVGAAVPDFTLLDASLSAVTRQDFRGKAVLFNVVHSLDSSICNLQTKRFNQELDRLPSSLEVVTVSADLPFAQARFAAAEKVGHRILSDYRDFSFAQAFGVGIKELRLLARSLFLINASGVVVYRQIVPEVAHHPNYEQALEAARKVG